ncbi:hypothetical protein RHGRI_035809 [Rhododendron griersonianum]|uniref:Uncharacterized protein n=1 Tax=Rhododendron griersonianum TaxID=479676 RepID=A0AAV6HLC5_9ERIC|nr:hypothetical protein RHGRI_035809 [Rhododendron griersonianum]
MVMVLFYVISLLMDSPICFLAAAEAARMDPFLGFRRDQEYVIVEADSQVLVNCSFSASITSVNGPGGGYGYGDHHSILVGFAMMFLLVFLLFCCFYALSLFLFPLFLSLVFQLEENNKKDPMIGGITNHGVANMIRFIVDSYNKPVPAILEIPSKDHPYDPSHILFFRE